jgi:hypothetical protein
MANEIYHRSNWGNAVNDKYWADVYEKYSATNKMYIRSDYYENSNVTDKLMADIYPKPSILLTPTAYDNGSLHSVKPVKTFGSELVTNGDFATDSDWNKTNATISNGVATVTVTSGGFSTINQNITYVSGKKYRITAQIQGLSGSNGKQIRFQDNGGNLGGLTLLNGVVTLDETLQNIEIIWTANSNSTEIVVARNTGSGDYSWTIDNVSVKEVTEADFDFTRGSSATRVNEKGLIEDVQILSGNLVQNGDFEQIGSELVTNGGFATDSDWSKGSNWTISGGSATSDGVNATSNLSQVVTSFSGKTFLVEGNASNVSQGFAYVSLGGTDLQIVVNSSGPFKHYVTISSGNSTLFISGRNNFIGSIDNVSVKEVGQNWTLSEGATVTDNGVRIISDGTYQRATQNNVLTVGKQYKLQYEITENNSGNLKAQTSLGISPIPSSVGTHTVYGEAAQTYLTIERNGVCDITIDNISVQEVTDDTDLPRINYTNFDYENGEVVPYSGEGSLLLEPQSTNKVNYSEDFSQWYTNDVTLETGYSAPDGSNNATKITSTGSNAYVFLSAIVLGTDTRTIYAKTVSGTGDIQLLSHNTNTNNVFTITEQWQRFEVNSTTSVVGNTNFYAIDLRGVSSTLTEIIVWAAQAEALSYATSYIVSNSGSTTTRLADVCNNAGSSDLINSTEGVLYFEGSDFDTSYNGGICISDLTYDNRVLFYFDSSGNVRAYIFANGIQLNYTTSGLDYTINHKYAIAWKNNDMRFFVDGVMLHSQATGNAPTGMNNLSFTSATASSDKFRGNAKCLSVFKEALDNDQLERLTGEGYETFNLLAQANNYTII